MDGPTPSRVTTTATVPAPVASMTRARHSGGQSAATVYVATSCPYGSGMKSCAPVTARPIVPTPTTAATTTGRRRRHTSGTDASAASRNSDQPAETAAFTGTATVAR